MGVVAMRPTTEREYLVAWQRRGQRPKSRQFGNREDARAWCARVWDRTDAPPVEMLQAFVRPLVPWHAVETFAADARPCGGER